MPSTEHLFQPQEFNVPVDAAGEIFSESIEPENLRKQLLPFAQANVDAVQPSQPSPLVPSAEVGSYTEQLPSIFLGASNAIKTIRRTMWLETSSIPPLAGGQDKGKSKNLPDESGTQQGMQFPRKLPDKEVEALFNTVDWELLETTHAVHARKQLMKVVKQLRPDWDEQTLAHKVLGHELDYKIDRYLKLKEKKGDSDRYVILLKEEIDFLQTLLHEKDIV